MIRQARNAGAKRTFRAAASLLLALQMANSLPATAAELRLSRANPASVSTRVMPQTRAGAPQDALLVSLDAAGERIELQLRPKTNLGMPARLRDHAIAYSGQVSGRPGSWAALTRMGSRWAGLWFDGRHYFGIDSAASLAAISADAARALPGSSLVFRLSDAAWDGIDLTGDMRVPGAPRSAGQTAEAYLDMVRAELSTPGTALATLPTKRLAVAMIADAELVARSSAQQTEANLVALLNIVDEIFASQVGVRLQAGSITLFDSATQPFTATLDSGVLLDELTEYRSDSAQQQAAGVSHLFTGRNLDGQTVGIAYLRALCNRTFGASLSEAYGNVSFAALIAAHELGHVFGAPHDAEAGSACESAPSGFLMSSQISGDQTFSSCSLAQIAPVVNNAQCLAPAEAADASLDAPPIVQVAVNQPTEVAIQVRSVGNVAVNGVALRITLPLVVNFVSAGGTGASCSAVGNVIDCALGSIPADEAVAVNLRFVALTPGTSGINLRIGASNDGLRTNDSGGIQVQAAEGADIAVGAGAVPAQLAPGATTTATFLLQNRSATSVEDARLSLTIPAGLVIVGQSVENTACAAVTNGLTCGPSTLAAGGEARVVLTLRADLAGNPVIVAEGSSSRPELQPSDNSASVAFVVRAPAPPPQPPAPAVSGGGGGGVLPPVGVLGVGLWLAQVARRRQRAQARAK